MARISQNRERPLFSFCHLKQEQKMSIKKKKNNKKEQIKNIGLMLVKAVMLITLLTV